MVKVLWFQQGGVHPAGKHRRHTELCQSLDVPAVGEVGSLTIPVLTLRSRIVIRIRVAPWWDAASDVLSLALYLDTSASRFQLCVCRHLVCTLFRFRVHREIKCGLND